MTPHECTDECRDDPHFPRGVMDPLCPDQHVITETMDRRILWHLENVLAVSATNDTLRGEQRNLKRYLNRVCAHHWHDDDGTGWDADPPFSPFRQCLWCNRVEDLSPAPSPVPLEGN